MFVSISLLGLLVTATTWTGAARLPQNRPAFLDLSQLDGKIVGGVNATIEQYPYQVSVQIRGKHACGGAIISNRFIVTAAHCLFPPASSYSIRAGSTFHNSDGVTIEVSELHIHPSFNKYTLDYDIGILKLAAELSFNSSIASIALPSENQEIAEGTSSVVTGWGYLNEGSHVASLQLQAVTVPIVGLNDCEKLYEDVNAVTDRMICAGFPEGGKDACQGDSGGPLAVNGQLIGVVSWGSGCARPNRPGVYASVPYLRSYVKQITGI